MKLSYPKIGLYMLALPRILRTPYRRISIAFAFSVVIHILVLWLPYLQWQHTKMILPPLTVRLELLPPQTNKSVEEAQKDIQPELILPENFSGKHTSGKSATNTAVALKKMEKSTSTQQLPKHLLLTFVVTKGEKLLQATTVRHQLEIQKDKYILYANRQTVDLSHLTDREKLVQISKGKKGERGLQPESYHEEIIVDGKKQDTDVNFDWNAHVLHFTNGVDLPIPPDTLDALSFMYQLSQVTLGKEIIPVTFFNGIDLEKIEIEIGRAEYIETKIGQMPALHLRKIHQPGEVYFEIWLGVDYRLLPVKFTRVDGSGEVVEQLLISDIRASDE